ncbi:MAG: hypothetical protein JNM25_16105 [Planctomycetes bacterium]|nr:hypothetical protein [Planctomycetota bacterium]
MRRSSIAAMLLAAACACGDPVMREPQPDWSGPPLAVTSRADRGLQLELLAPTAGHSFELRAVVQADGTADVQTVHRTPGAAFTAQVITPLPLLVPPDRLADCRRIRVWVTTLHGADDVREPAAQLAFVLRRP